MILSAAIILMWLTFVHRMLGQKYYQKNVSKNCGDSSAISAILLKPLDSWFG